MQVGGRAVPKCTIKRGRPPASLARPTAPTSVRFAAHHTRGVASDFLSGSKGAGEHANEEYDGKATEDTEEVRGGIRHEQTQGGEADERGKGPR